MKSLFFLTLIFIYLSVYPQNTKPDTIHDPELDSIFTPYKGAFVLYDPATSTYQVYNEKRAQEKFPAHSTVKLALAAAALNQQIVKDENDITQWDSTKYPRQDKWTGYPFEHWTTEQNIITAIRYSVNWYFIELTKKMDMQKTKDWLSKYNYGQLPDTLYPFYFAISNNVYTSAYDQICFLEKLYSKTFDLSENDYLILKEGIYFDTKNQVMIYSKSGGGDLRNGDNIGWNIGFVEQNNKVYFYALNVEAKDFDTIKDLRYTLTWKILEQLGLFN